MHLEGNAGWLDSFFGFVPRSNILDIGPSHLDTVVGLGELGARVGYLWRLGRERSDIWRVGTFRGWGFDVVSEPPNLPTPQFLNLCDAHLPQSQAPQPPKSARPSIDPVCQQIIICHGQAPMR